MNRTGSKWQAWGLIGPGLLWTAAFFIVPLLIMGGYSLCQRVAGRVVADWSLTNYLSFFSKIAK